MITNEHKGKLNRRDARETITNATWLQRDDMVTEDAEREQRRATKETKKKTTKREKTQNNEGRHNNYNPPPKKKEKWQKIVME